MYRTLKNSPRLKPKYGELSFQRINLEKITGRGCWRPWYPLNFEYGGYLVTGEPGRCGVNNES